MPLVALDNVHLSYSGETVLKEVSFQVKRGDRVALVGRNGAGKTSLLEIIRKTIKPDQGSVALGDGLRIGYLKQVPELGDEPTLLEAVVAGRGELLTLKREIHSLQETAEDGSPQVATALSALQERYEREGGDDLERRATVALQSVGFEAAQFDQPTNLLSGGEQNRLLLARILLMDADLLLLDEPTNHLDIQGTEFLEQYLAAFSGGAVVVSNDRTFIDRFATSIMAIESDGTLDQYPGSYERYRDIRSQRREETEESRSEEDTLHFTEVEHSGKVVYQVKDLWLQPGGQTLLEKAEFSVARGERIGIIGPTGSGTTALLETLAGRDEPTRGKLQQGFNTMVGFYDQTLSSLTTGRTVLEELAACRPDLDEQALQDMAGRFLFCGDDVHRKIESFSGGEQSRLALALLVLGRHNVLLLNEPTNHLDIPSREVLEEALEAYPSTVIVVSHDRFFLDRVAKRILSIESRALVDELGVYSKLRQTRKIMHDVPRTSPGIDSPKQQRREEPAKRKKSQPVEDNQMNRADNLKALIKEQEKKIEGLMEQMADPSRSLDWEGLEKLQAEKNSLEKEHASNLAEWERLQAASKS